MVRTFVGIAIPEDIKVYVTAMQHQLRSLPIEAKFVEPDNIHISLSFLGDVEEDEIGKIKFKLDEISKAYEKFEVSLGNILLIPTEKYVRVVALDIGSEQLESIRKDVVKSIGGRSYPVHLTLARIKSIDEKSEFPKRVKDIIIKNVHFEIDGISLIKSVLQKSGPIYTVIHKTHLK